MQTIFRPYKDNHIIDCFYPFFYILQHISTGMYYAGYKGNTKAFFCQGGYCSSSQSILSIIKKEGFQALRIVKIRYYRTYEEALEYETRFLRKIDAKNNPYWYNQHNGDGKFVIKKHSESTKRKIKASWDRKSDKEKARIKAQISKKLIGKSYLTETGRLKKIKSLKGNNNAKGSIHPGHHTIEGRRAISLTHLGKKHSKQLKLKMSSNRKGKGKGLTNAMANPENRFKVGQSKIGRKKMSCPNKPSFMVLPNSQRWFALIAEGYK